MEGFSTRRCGALGLPDGSVRWRVWVPRARQVELVLLEGGRRRAVPMRREDGGYFVHTEANVAEGQRYAYRLDNGPERPDPDSLWQPDGIHAPSAVLRPERFVWTDDGWRGVALEDLVFYELHVGTFTPEGTFEAIIPRLSALKELGVTAVEIMPVAQFPGRRNWGYDGVHPYAVQNSYGGPHGLQKLVEACHAAGLALFLDVVYNHLGPEGNYLHEFGPYFTDRHPTPWGRAVNYDGPDSGPVRDFVLDNVRLWFEAYRVDGLRLDATHAMHDAGPVHILRQIKEAADGAAARLGRRALVVAEHLRNDVRVVLPPDQGGDGLDAQWNDDFHHAVHAFLTGERQGYYQDFGPARDLPRALEHAFVLDGGFSRYRGRPFGAPAGDVPGDRFVSYVQNHDQVGNRARGDRLSTLLGDPPRLRLAASLLLLSPQLPLLFMGEEYGEERPFPFFCSFLNPRLADAVRKGRRRDYAALMEGEVPDPQDEATFGAARLSWSWPEGTPRAGLRRLYQDLLAARRQWPALRDFTRRPARLLPDAEAGPVLELRRGENLRAFFNLSAEPQPLPGRGAEPHPVLFSSEASRYSGVRQEGAPVAELLPYECVVFGPPSPSPQPLSPAVGERGWGEGDKGGTMSEAREYVLGQSARAARRLEVQDAHFAEVSERLLDELALRPNDRVVELGCGPGGFSRRVLRRLGAGGTLVAVDSSEGLLAQARAALAGAGPAKFEPVRGDIAELGPWLDGADVVVARTVLHHVPMAEFLLGRLRAAVRPGTRVGFLEPDFRAPLARLAHLEAGGRRELEPLRVWATAINQLYLANRLSPAVGASLARALELAGYRRVREAWAECPTNALAVENMQMFYDEVRDRLASLGILAAEEVARQQQLLRTLPLGSLPAVWGTYRVAAEA